ncbi:MAG: FAD-dependent oxidoreductase [Pseudomonadota bacterium]
MAGLGAGAAALGVSSAALLPALGRERTIIVGGGPAGAEAALAWRQRRPASAVLLIERDPSRLGPPSAAAAFERPAAQTGLDTLRSAGVDVALDEAVGVDWPAARLALLSGREIAFDRLVVAPGTAPLAEPIPGLDAAARHRWPAAWGSAREARRLKAGLLALGERAHAVLRLPAALSHPQVALDRAVLLALWLQRQRPSARLTVLDATPDDTLARAFRARFTGPIVDWRRSDAGGVVLALDAPAGTIETTAGLLRADLVNFVTPRMAGRLAAVAGLADDSGWCPCTADGQSQRRPRTLVLGDARKAALRTVASAELSANLSIAAIA